MIVKHTTYVTELINRSFRKLNFAELKEKDSGMNKQMNE